MSDTVKKWHEMQEEKILSDQGGEYTVPHKGAESGMVLANPVKYGGVKVPP